MRSVAKTRGLTTPSQGGDIARENTLRRVAAWTQRSVLRCFRPVRGLPPVACEKWRSNPGGECRACLLDGSPLQLEASPRLRKLYPPAENQHGRAHWPVLRVLAVPESETGLAEEPPWGAIHRAAAVSEQGLAEKAMDALAPGSRLQPKLFTPSDHPDLPRALSGAAATPTPLAGREPVRLFERHRAETPTPQPVRRFASCGNEWGT